MALFFFITQNISWILKNAPLHQEHCRHQLLIVNKNTRFIEKNYLYCVKSFAWISSFFSFFLSSFFLLVWCYCMCLTRFVVQFNAINYVKFIHHIDVWTQTYYSISYFCLLSFSLGEVHQAPNVLLAIHYLFKIKVISFFNFAFRHPIFVYNFLCFLSLSLFLALSFSVIIRILFIWMGWSIKRSYANLLS